MRVELSMDELKELMDLIFAGLREKNKDLVEIICKKLRENSKNRVKILK